MQIEMRPLTADDASLVHEITRAAEIADRAPLTTTLDEIELRLSAPHLDLASDSRLALLDGARVGFAYVDHAPSGERLERAHLYGEVHPDHRRRGVGSVLFEWQLARGTERLSSYEHELPRYVRTDQRVARTDATSLYERFGLIPVRYTDELIRTLDQPIEQPSIDGITLVPLNPTRSDEVRSVKNAAFADHWGSTPSDEAAWEHMLDDECVRLDLSMIALDGDRIVGYSLNEHYAADEEITGRRDGWIGSIGVLRGYRGGGIASALIAASAEAFRSSGFTHAMLGVDTENPSGAYGLYQRLGFQPCDRLVTHEIEVAR